MFSGMGPDELAEYQRVRGGYDVPDAVQMWTLDMEGLQASKSGAYAALRSFFAHNRAGLPDDAEFRIRGDLEKVGGTLTVDDLKLVLSGCNRMFRTAYLCMFQGGMGTRTRMQYQFKFSLAYATPRKVL